MYKDLGGKRKKGTDSNSNKCIYVYSFKIEMSLKGNKIK